MECQCEENGHRYKIGKKPLDAALLKNRFVGVHAHLISPYARNIISVPVNVNG